MTLNNSLSASPLIDLVMLPVVAVKKINSTGEGWCTCASVAAVVSWSAPLLLQGRNVSTCDTINAYGVAPVR